MPEYLSPGVYVEEVNRGPKPIEAVGTSTACFIGFTEKAESTRVIDGETVTENLLGKPVFVTNWSQYREAFGDLVPGAYLPLSVYGFFQNGGSKCYVLSVKTIPRAQNSLVSTDGKPRLTVRAKQAGFDGASYRVRIESTEPPKAAGGVAPAAPKKPATKEGDAPQADAPPGGAPPAAAAEAPAAGADGDGVFSMFVDKQTRSGEWKNLESRKDVRLTEVELDDGKKEIRFAYPNNKPSTLIDLLITDPTSKLAQLAPRTQEQSLVIQPALMEPAAYSNYQGDILERTGIEGLAELDDISIVAVPDLMSKMPGQKKLDLNMVKAVQTSLIAHCEGLGDRVAILDTPPDMNAQEVRNWRMNVTGFDSSYATMYYPWIEVMDAATNQMVMMPPSGHVAGVWARTDNTRGVHKAPANEVVMGCTKLGYNVTKGEQDTLNPIGVNCIRFFPGMGYRIWGARTLSSDAAWRYIPVRRLFNMVEQTLRISTMWAVFEPNDQFLWSRLRRDVGNFLMGLYGQGMLFGASAGQAFYVKCDAELNPSYVRDLGQLFIEVGISPVKPAEFIIFRIGQWAGE
ncbi:MAG: phage tail sheath family protein [Caldilineaceae bacterium]